MKRITGIVFAALCFIGSSYVGSANAAYHYTSPSEGKITLASDLRSMVVIDGQGNSTRYYRTSYVIDQVDDLGNGYTAITFAAVKNSKYEIALKSYDKGKIDMFGLIDGKQVLVEEIHYDGSDPTDK